IVAAKAALIRSDALTELATAGSGQARHKRGQHKQDKRGSFLMKFARPTAAPVIVSVLAAFSVLLVSGLVAAQPVPPQPPPAGVPPARRPPPRPLPRRRRNPCPPTGSPRTNWSMPGIDFSAAFPAASL